MNDHHLSPGNLRREQNPAYGPLRPILSIKALLEGARHPNMMTDQQKWDAAVARVLDEYENLSDERRGIFSRVAERIMSLKLQLVAVCADIDCATICSRCGGQCCVTGKYHFTVVDLLAYRVTGMVPPVPDFTRPAGCPYGTEEGCLMSAEYRPYNCITFICDEIEGGLDGNVEFYRLAGLLRDAYAEVEALCHMRLMGGLLQTIDAAGLAGMLGAAKGGF